MGRVLKIDRLRPQRKSIDEAVEVLRSGGIVILPTDTVYGIAASPEHAGAMNRIYKLKSRSLRKPLVRLIASERDLKDIVPPSPLVRSFIRKFWPGPLTLIFKKSKGKTVGYRVPEHKVALGILRKTGPLAVTSANISGGKSISSIREMESWLLDRVDLVVDAGDCPLKRESTVLDVTSVPFRILRKGAVKRLPAGI